VLLLRPRVGDSSGHVMLLYSILSIFEVCPPDGVDSHLLAKCDLV
jgi:hypothetical protein